VPDPVTTLSVTSFNSHYGFLPARPVGPRFDIAGALRVADADVIVVQEVWRPDGATSEVDDAAAALGFDMRYALFGRATTRARWPHSSPGGEGTIGLAVLSRLPMGAVRPIPLGPTPRDPVPGRAALDVEIDVGGTAVHVVGAHLTSQLPHGPLLQLRRLAGSIPPLGVPTILAGDCNFWGFGVRNAFRGWRRAVRGRTWPAPRPHSQIDHILVRPQEFEVVEGKVLTFVGSDHRPVRAVLRLVS